MGKATARGIYELWGEWDNVLHAEQLKRIDQLVAMLIATATPAAVNQFTSTSSDSVELG